MENNRVLTHSPSLFHAPGTEAFALQNFYLLTYLFVKYTELETQRR